MRSVSLLTASRVFSKLIKVVERGEGFVITRRRWPIAKLVPHTADKTADPAWSAAYRRTTARLEEGECLGGLGTVRDELHGR